MLRGAVQYVQNVQKDSYISCVLNNLNVLNMGGHLKRLCISVAVFSCFPAHLAAGKYCGVLFNSFKMFKRDSHLTCFEHSEHFEQVSGAD
jgi:hypothetical protein